MRSWQVQKALPTRMAAMALGNEKRRFRTRFPQWVRADAAVPVVSVPTLVESVNFLPAPVSGLTSRRAYGSGLYPVRWRLLGVNKRIQFPFTNLSGKVSRWKTSSLRGLGRQVTGQ